MKSTILAALLFALALAATGGRAQPPGANPAPAPDVASAAQGQGTRHVHDARCNAWIEGRFEVVRERAWVPGSVERVWVPPVYRTTWTSTGNPVQTLAVPGHYEERARPGRWEVVERRVWVPGRWERRCGR